MLIGPYMNVLKMLYITTQNLTQQGPAPNNHHQHISAFATQQTRTGSQQPPPHNPRPRPTIMPRTHGDSTQVSSTRHTTLPATTVLSRPSRYSDKLLMEQVVNFTELLVCSSLLGTTLPSMRALLGMFVADIAAWQLCVLKECQNLSTLPGIYQTNLRTQISTLRNKGVTVTKAGRQQTTVQATLLTEHLKEVTALYQRFSEDPPITSTRGNHVTAPQPNTNSLAFLKEILRTVRRQHLVTQLQEAFISLCCHTMYPTDQYRKFISQLPWLSSTTEKVRLQRARQAERFVHLLIQLQPKAFEEVLNMLHRRYVECHIPASDMATLADELATHGSLERILHYEFIEVCVSV